MRRYLVSILLIVTIFMTACSLPSSDTGVTKDWEMIEDSGKSSTLNLYAWGGDKEANDWIDTFLKPKLLENFDITLKRIPMEYNDIFSMLESDKLNENNMGEIDLIWISGDAFKYAYNNDYLYGPFTEKLPNLKKYVNMKDKEVKYDLMFPTKGYEVPFGKSQFTLFYDADAVLEAPKNLDEFIGFVKEYPGMFTYPSPPEINGSAFVRSVIYNFVSYKELMELEVEKEIIKEAIKPAMNYLKSIEPHLWKEGSRYPSTGDELDELFLNGEVLMSMNFDHNHGTDMIKEYLYPDGTKPMLLGNMVGRTHYLAIPYNSTNKSGALLAINYCLDVGVQANKFKLRTWGDIPVLERSLLTPEELRLVSKGVTKKTSPKLEMLMDNRVPDMSTDLKNIIDEIWMEEFEK